MIADVRAKMNHELSSEQALKAIIIELSREDNGPDQQSYWRCLANIEIIARSALGEQISVELRELAEAYGP
jgi:hypothetical protein